MSGIVANRLWQDGLFRGFYWPRDVPRAQYPQARLLLTNGRTGLDEDTGYPIPAWRGKILGGSSLSEFADARTGPPARGNYATEEDRSFSLPLQRFSHKP